MYKLFGQSGRSMIEMLGVLAIIGVLSAGGIAGYSMAMANYKANKAMDMVQFMSTQAKTLYGTNFGGISASGLFNLGYIASDVANGSGPTSSPFGTTWNIAAATVGTANAGFTITINDVPSSACVKLAQAYWGDSSFFVNMKIGVTEFLNADNPTKSASDAITTCGTATSNLSWSFK